MNSNQNLLPKSFQKRLLVWARIRQWVAICGCILLIFGFWTLLEYSRMSSQQVRLVEMDERAMPFRKITRENVQLRTQLKGLITKEASISKISNSELHLQILGILSQSTRPLSEKIQVIDLKVAGIEKDVVPQINTPGNTPVPQNRAVTKVQKEKGIKLDLRGLAVNDATIAEFIRALEEYNFFTSIELKTVNRVDIAKQTVRAYQIECVH